MKKGRKIIVVVEDEPLLRQVMCRFIGILGYRVICYGSGAEALEGLREVKPDALILDNNLTDVTGLELYRKLRERNDAVPALLISAYEPSPGDIGQARELGIRGLYRKPFSFDQLRRGIRSLFRRPFIFTHRARFYSNRPEYDLRPKVIALQVFRKIFREGLDHGGHVHFHFEGHQDHVILLCSRHTIGKVIAKSPGCGHGECVKWEQSSFAGYHSEKVISELNQKINQVRVDAADYEMSWPTLADFLCWLELNY